MSKIDPFELPEGLPVPEDDGACRHLTGARLPSESLPSTTGGAVGLSKIAGTIVVYCYPRTGAPAKPSRRDGTTFPERGAARPRHAHSAIITKRSEHMRPRSSV